VLMADHYGLITECNENNNEGSKVIKPCSNSGNAILTGNLSSGLLATNGKFDLVNFTPSANTVIAVSTSHCMYEFQGQKRERWQQ
ncbi:MAG: hypothetical protein ACI9V1_002973, partial [Spirosomataceae bacterium]